MSDPDRVKYPIVYAFIYFSGIRSDQILSLGPNNYPKVPNFYDIEALNIGSHVFLLLMSEISVIMLLLHKLGEMRLAIWKRG